jgi:hypothetical protein
MILSYSCIEITKAAEPFAYLNSEMQETRIVFLCSTVVIKYTPITLTLKTQHRVNKSETQRTFF